MATPIVGSVSGLTSGMLKDLFRQLDDGSIMPWQLQAFLEHRDPFTTFPAINWLETAKALGLETEYREGIKTLQLADNPNLWSMPMFPGLTSNKVVAGHKRLGVKFYLHADDLDAAVPKHDRDPNKQRAYVVAFRCNVEADEEFKNLSANQLAKQGHKGITLPERLWLGAGFYVATGQHLDVESITLCAGSRHSAGYVPYVSFYTVYRSVYVYWYRVGYSDGRLRSRSVVS